VSRHPRAPERRGIHKSTSAGRGKARARIPGFNADATPC
jgi:hypothetical protein